jgi:hypothetical protein
LLSELLSVRGGGSHSSKPKLKKSSKSNYSTPQMTEEQQLAEALRQSQQPQTRPKRHLTEEEQLAEAIR